MFSLEWKKKPSTDFKRCYFSKCCPFVELLEPILFASYVKYWKMTHMRWIILHNSIVFAFGYDYLLIASNGNRDDKFTPCSALHSRVYFFRMFEMCRTCSGEYSGTEHSARTNRTVCGVYQVLRWCRRNQDGGTDYLFFYIEFFYTLLIFLKLCNTKKYMDFLGGRRDFVNCEYSHL